MGRKKKKLTGRETLEERAALNRELQRISIEEKFRQNLRQLENPDGMSRTEAAAKELALWNKEKPIKKKIRNDDWKKPLVHEPTPPKKKKKNRKPRQRTLDRQKKRDEELREKVKNMPASHGEKLIMAYLSKKGISYKKDYIFEDLVLRGKNKTLFFDFYLPDMNTCIEFDGEFHFLPINGEAKLLRQQRNDKLKDMYCVKNKIRMLRIHYQDKSRLDSILDEFLKL